MRRFSRGGRCLLPRTVGFACVACSCQDGAGLGLSSEETVLKTVCRLMARGFESLALHTPCPMRFRVHVRQVRFAFVAKMSLK